MLTKSIDLTDLSASDVGTMLHVFELNVKNPIFAQQKNSSNGKVFWGKNYVIRVNLKASESSSACLNSIRYRHRNVYDEQW